MEIYNLTQLVSVETNDNMKITLTFSNGCIKHLQYYDPDNLNEVLEELKRFRGFLIIDGQDLHINTTLL